MCNDVMLGVGEGGVHIEMLMFFIVEGAAGGAHRMASCLSVPPGVGWIVYVCVSFFLLPPEDQFWPW